MCLRLTSVLPEQTISYLNAVAAGCPRSGEICRSFMRAGQRLAHTVRFTFRGFHIMRTTLLLIASATTVGCTSLPAQAQWSNSGYDDDVIRCESRDGRTERCDTYGGDAQLVRQLSSNPCVRGRTWGTDSRGVWVSSGCRAEFRINSGYGYDNGYGSGYGYDSSYGNSSDGLFRCESRDGRTERCNTYGGRVQFIRQLSDTRCVRGQSWGSDSRGVWVSNGCRALFSANGAYGNNYGNNHGNGNDLVRCESRDNRSQSCAISAGRNGNIRLLRQLSGKPCIENQTWGRSRTGVWVTQGCRAEFITGRGGNNGGSNQRPPGDLGGGVPGGKRPGVFEDTSSRRPPGDLGDTVMTPANQRPSAPVRQRPTSEVITSRPGDTAVVRRQTRPVEEAPGRLEVQTVEEASPGQVQRRNTGGTAEPGVVEGPAPRERGVERGERPR